MRLLEMGNQRTCWSALSLYALALISLFAQPAVGQPALDRLSVPNLPSTLFNYVDIDFPDYFFGQVLPRTRFQTPVMENDNTPGDNPTTDEGATLGRVLFYDISLSQNGTISCASCHKQELGFSDDRRRSVGFAGGETRRHSMGLTNARFNRRRRAFWDERAASLEDQALQPVQDLVEMGLTLAEAEDRVRGQSFYPPLFEAAFGDPQVTSDRMAKAIAQYVRSLVSVGSKYDTGRAMVDSPLDRFPNFTPEENAGKFLFMASRIGGGADCVGCHTTEAFINSKAGPINPGLDLSNEDDSGAFEATGQIRDSGAFRIPSLKNIGVTAPYMHDGRFATLEEVVEHYSTDVQANPNLDVGLQDFDGSPLQFNFTQGNISSIVAFLHTLTDHEMLRDVRFSDPFSPR